MAINHGLQAQIFRLSSIRTKYPGYSNLIYDSNGKIINRPICGPKIQPRVFKKPDTVFYKQAKLTRANPKKMPKENTEETDITWRTREHSDKNDS
ncbi:hypothetical protein FOPG_04112 [Fusarium oxysporum f. sp. conglutinans race 2 54008]|uniref:Uncharacterized protein n=4 Tax=Fusarium oxysporum TaxID=5507 RepID=A0A8H6H0X6_FUSOX|nr:hypothetical protein FOXB_10883 [Fusarium oxysporum f. sp. conglutinans Fo5176]EXA49070.1 hypothetical protein FOVG_02366 [Fusarium oxysporum f. sp. pisi HDV247]EXL83099.1 hypothetical protein FOPG_04112 [Fusarium oxysporum f. sp. conglutinans race 2 54008]KAF6527197.1 hypothetical protein HZS61_010241 [Fusarium oxysporum f. sp. conglutinans]KAI8415585.1 hypothetical protein FOFC_05210 [Fusarium oxysporum]